jgi:transcriptional regulator with XRE-family HTH domain
LTQKEMAASLGLKSVRTVTAWENGAYAPSLKHVLRLARVLGVSVEELVSTVVGLDAEIPGEPRGGKVLPVPVRIAGRRPASGAYIRTL